MIQVYLILFLCFGDHASMYNLVDKANLVHNLFLVYLKISTCFGRLCAHHQEKQLCLCDTWYLLFCVDDCLVCRMELHPQYQKKYTKNNLCTKLTLSTSLSFIYIYINSCFRASQFNFNKNPTRCNSMQIFIHCKVTLHVSGVTAPIIRSTKNCNRNLRYRS